MIIIQRASEEHICYIVEFQVAMAYETEQMVLNKDTVLKGVRKIFDNTTIGFYLLALSERKVVGSLLCLYEWSDWRNAFVIWIHSVYVVPEFRRRGVFKMLYSYLRNMVNNDKNFCGLRLYVEKRNTNAQLVYKKLGMNNEHYELFEWLKQD